MSNSVDRFRSNHSAAQPIPFTFEGQNVRTFTIDGAPWFVLGDVCKVLDLRVDAVKTRLDQADHSTTGVWSAENNRNYAVTIVNESGLYDVILDSRKPQAKAFRRWITAEVIPSIRKTGSYTAQEVYQDQAGEPEGNAGENVPAAPLDPNMVTVLEAMGNTLAMVADTLGTVNRVLDHLDLQHTPAPTATASPNVDLEARLARLEDGAEVSAGVRVSNGVRESKAPAVARRNRKRTYGMSLTQFSKEYFPTHRRCDIRDHMLALGWLQRLAPDRSNQTGALFPTSTGSEWFKTNHPNNGLRVKPGAAQDMADALRRFGL